MSGQNFRTWQRVSILDVPVDRVSMPALLRWIADLRRDDPPHWLVTLNLNYLTVVRRNHRLGTIIKNADLIVPDAMPLVWASKALGAPVPHRITGHDLVWQCAALAADRGLSVFLLGGGPGIAQAAAARLRHTYSGLSVMAMDGGPVNDSGEAQNQASIAAKIKAFQPQILFVALGVPKQDFWIHRNLHHMNVPVCAGIGCVFDVVAGRIDRAPPLMQQYGLEWLFQLYQDPKRLWKRFLIGCAPTAFRLAAHVVSARLSSMART